MNFLNLILVSFTLFIHGFAQTLVSSSAVPTHTVSVAATGNVFTPNSIDASVGDIIEFRFYPLNHSVARAEYKQPCIPYEQTGPGKVGFWSGFFPLSVIPSSPPSFQVRVNDTEPVFFYCAAPGACHDDGMVGVINPNVTETLDVQVAYAHNSSFAFSPGETFPVESSSSSTTISTPTAISSPSSTATSSPTASATAAAAASSSSSISSGAIAGIAIGGVAALALAGAVFYICGRQRTVKEIVKQQTAQGGHGPMSSSFNTGHMSMASSTAYTQRKPNFENGTPGMARYSGQQYSHSAPDSASYRSRSPHTDEGRELAPHMNLGNSAPILIRPSPVSPTMDDLNGVYQPLTAGPIPQRQSSEGGPHELPVDGNQENAPRYEGYEYRGDRNLKQ